MSRLLRESLPVGIADTPEIHKFWGSFLDLEIEHQFAIENYKLQVQRYVRFSVVVSIAVFLAYGIHDALVVPEIRTQAWMIRYLGFGPVALLLVAFVMRNRSPSRHQVGMIVFGLAVNAVVLGIGALAPAGAYFIYSGYAPIFVAVGPFIARMNMRTQLAYTALTLVLFNVLDVLVAHAATVASFSLNLTILSLGLLGAFAARQMDLQGRLAFLQRRIIRDQMAELEAERARSERLLLNVLPRRIADRLKAKPNEIIADRFKSATVLFSDIVGFTQLSTKLEPDELVKRLDTIFSRFDEIAGELGLEKIKTIGDAYMVCGGVPTARADHAEAVCDMALRMRDSLEALAAQFEGKLEVRIGVHTGPVIAGVIGKKKFIYDVWGDTVNTASRMESHGIPLMIQVSEATFELTKDQFEYETRGVIEVKGKGEMRTHLLVRRREVEVERVALTP